MEESDELKNNINSSELPLLWVGYVSDLCELLVKELINFSWKCWQSREAPESVEYWCLNALGWRKEDLINVVGPITFETLSKSEHPSNLSYETALDLSLLVIPKIPYRLKCVIQKICKFKHIGYHDDIKLSEEELQNLITFVNDYSVSYFSMLKDTFEKAFRQKTKVLRNSLIASKRKLRKLRKKTLQQKINLERSKSELQRSQIELVSEIKYEDFEINTDLLHSKSKTFSKVRRKSICSNLSNLVFSETNLDSENESFNKFCDTEILIKDEFTSVTSHDIPDELRDENFANSSDEEFSFGNEFHERLCRKGSTKSSLLAIEEDLSRQETLVLNLQQNKKQFLAKYKEFFKQFESFRTKILFANNNELLTNPKYSHFITKGKEVLKNYQSSSFYPIVNKLRNQCLCYSDSKAVIDIKEWFTNKCFTLHEAVDVNLINLYPKHERSVVDINYLFDPRHEEVVSIISGNSGSGKSHLCSYIFNQWRKFSTLHPSLLTFDIVDFLNINQLRKYSSYTSYLESIFLADREESSTESLLIELQNSSTLLIIDSDCMKEEDISIIESISDVSFTKAIISVRSEYEPMISEALHKNNLKSNIIRISPLTSVTLNEKAMDTLGIKSSVLKTLTEVIEAPTMDPSVINPLYLSFIYFLLMKNESEFEITQTKSKLLARLLAFSRKKIMRDLNVIEDKFPYDNSNSKYEHIEMKQLSAIGKKLGNVKLQNFADLLLEELWETSWVSYFEYNTKSKENNIVKIKLSFTVDDEWLYPLIIRLDDGNFAIFHSICESLSGFHYAQHVCSKSIINWLLCINPEDVLTLKSEEIPFRKEPLIVSAGLLKLPKRFKHRLFKKLVSNFRTSMKIKTNFLLWLRLMKEAEFSNKVNKIIRSELKEFKTWTTCSGIGCSDKAVATLLRYEAFKPKLVIISEKCPSISDMVCGLALCPRVNVVIRQMFQFCMWDETNASDELVESLQPTGNLIEFWGYIGPEGCNALRHMKRLRKAHIRITNLEALLNLALSLNQIGSMNHLALNLDLPKSTPITSVPFLEFKRKSFDLTFRNINDSTVDWAKQILKTLCDKYTNVYFETTKLSCDNLDNLKKENPTVSLFII